MKTIHTNEAPAAIGPYSQGIIVNKLFLVQVKFRLLLLVKW